MIKPNIPMPKERFALQIIWNATFGFKNCSYGSGNMT
jgi:hypothetical protein